MEQLVGSTKRNAAPKWNAATEQLVGSTKRTVAEAKRIVAESRRAAGEAKRLVAEGPGAAVEAAAVAGKRAAVAGKRADIAGERAAVAGERAIVAGERAAVAGKRAPATAGKRAPAAAGKRAPTAAGKRAPAAAGKRAAVVTKHRGRGRPVEGDKRREILDAGLRMFAERGYHGTAVPEVARVAKVSIGSLYRYFANKDALVNEVYRDAKERLRAALFTPVLPVLDPYQAEAAQRWFEELWRRLGVFAAGEPDAFRFLEMQDHVAYLDAQSRQVELAVLAPLWLAGKRLHDRASGAAAAPVDVLIALLWGAFVGLVKAGRLGYLRVDDKAFMQAGAACWRMIGPEASRAASNPRPVRAARASKGPP